MDRSKKALKTAELMDIIENEWSDDEGNNGLLLGTASEVNVIIVPPPGDIIVTVKSLMTI